MSGNPQSRQSGNYLKWKEALGEITYARHVLEAMDGELPESSTRHEHLGHLEQTWSDLREELRLIEESPEDMERITFFIENDGKDLEELVAFLIGSYLLADDAKHKMNQAESEAPEYISKNFEVDKYEQRVQDMGSASKKRLKAIDSGVMTVDRYYKQRYDDGDRSQETMESIRFIEDISQSIEQFIDSGNIGGPLRNEVKQFVQERMQKIHEEEEKSRRDSRKAVNSQSKGWGSFR